MHQMAAPHVDSSPTSPNLHTSLSAALKCGTLIPNRIFVGGISGDTTESDLSRVFSAYGNVKTTKIIVDRAGISKGYGFVTFETEQEAQRIQTKSPSVMLRDRKLNIAPAIKKPRFLAAASGALLYTTTNPTAPLGSVSFDQFLGSAAFPAGMHVLYPQSMPYQPIYQYISVPLNVPPSIWPQNYQDRENSSDQDHSRDRDNVVVSESGNGTFSSSSSSSPPSSYNFGGGGLKSAKFLAQLWSASKSNSESTKYL